MGSVYLFKIQLIHLCSSSISAGVFVFKIHAFLQLSSTVYELNSKRGKKSNWISYETDRLNTEAAKRQDTAFAVCWRRTQPRYNVRYWKQSGSERLSCFRNPENEWDLGPSRRRLDWAFRQEWHLTVRCSQRWSWRKAQGTVRWHGIFRNTTLLCSAFWCISFRSLLLFLHWAVSSQMKARSAAIVILDCIWAIKVTSYPSTGWKAITQKHCITLQHSLSHWSHWKDAMLPMGKIMPLKLLWGWASFSLVLSSTACTSLQIWSAGVFPLVSFTESIPLSHKPQILFIYLFLLNLLKFKWALVRSYL